MAFNAFPSMTNPTSGTIAPEVVDDVLEGGRNPKSLRSCFCGSWNCFTSSSAQLRMDSQVSYREQYDIEVVSNSRVISALFFGLEHFSGHS
jgi:hypothetical protein